MTQHSISDFTSFQRVAPWMFSTDTLFPRPLDSLGLPGTVPPKPPGVAMIYPVKDMVVRAWLLCGRSYSVHPLDCIDADGTIVPLPTVRGLVPSESPAFDWQIDTRRRLLVVAQAENELACWADAYL